MGDHNGRGGNEATPLTERLQALAASRRPDDHALPGFLEAYYRELPDFDVDDRTATRLIAELRARVPGYLVPRLVREVPGELSKTPIA